MFEIPHYAAEVYIKREDLRNLREHVLLVVRDYNRFVAFRVDFVFDMSLLSNILPSASFVTTENSNV